MESFNQRDNRQINREIFNEPNQNIIILYVKRLLSFLWMFIKILIFFFVLIYIYIDVFNKTIKIRRNTYHVFSSLMSIEGSILYDNVIKIFE